MKPTNPLAVWAAAARSTAVRLLDSLDELMQAVLLVGLASTLAIALAGCNGAHSAAAAAPQPAASVDATRRSIDEAPAPRGAPSASATTSDEPPPSF